MEGNTLTLRYDDLRNSQSLTVESCTDGGFRYTMGNYSPVRPFVNAGQLAGQYSGGQFIGSGGDRLIDRRTLLIRPDGSYSTEGVASGVPDNGSDIGVTGNSRGRWQWSGYYLTMTDGAGRSSRVIAFPIGKNVAFFGGILYERK